MLATIGAGGLHDYLSDLALASQWTLTQRFTVGDVVGHGPLLYLLQFAIAVLSLFAAWRHRGRGIELPLAAGIVGSLLVTPYIGYQDFLMLVLASWLVLRAGASHAQVAVMAAGYLALEFGLVFGTLPVVLCELALLGTLCLPAPSRGGAQIRIAAA